MVTTASRNEAEKIAQSLLNKRLIACANIIGPIFSLFHWSGMVEKNKEYLVLMKSHKNLFEELSETVKRLHSYEVPEILAFPIMDGSEEYLDWLDSCLASSNKRV